ncbi:MAG: hypothetical protein MZW92_27390 [Comamonadaceae bacterium]|nr:hypothetical protein [Comamonadaceae bacterium]
MPGECPGRRPGARGAPARGCRDRRGGPGAHRPRGEGRPHGAQPDPARPEAAGSWPGRWPPDRACSSWTRSWPASTRRRPAASSS